MSAQVDLKDPCPCGSGMLYKDCCRREAIIEARQKRNKLILSVILVAAVVGALFYVRNVDDDAIESLVLPEGSVFDEEHGHWHGPDGAELYIPGKIWDMNRRKFVNAPEGAGGPPYPQPEGPVPDGKVWSPEHGHWHDVTPPEEGVPEPAGEAPEGQVWSVEHGHYHDE